jgi:hypothetical protein
MPKKTIKYASEDEIPSELKSFANGLTVEVWVGDSVAEETNPDLKNQIATLTTAKTTAERNYQTQLDANSQLLQKNQELNIKVNNGVTIQPEDVEYINKLKELGTPDDIVHKVSKSEGDKEELKNLRLDKKAELICEKMGWTNKKLVKERIGLSGNVSFEVKDDKVQVSYKDAENKDVTVDMNEYVEKNETWNLVAGLLNADSNSAPRFPIQTNSDGKPNNQQASTVGSFIDSFNKKGQPAQQEQK